MLTIREEQLQAFSLAMYQRFVVRAVRHLAAMSPPPNAAEPALTQLVERGITYAATFGITAETHVMRFLEYLVLYGEDFGATPNTKWAGTILRTEAVSAGWKLNRIDDAALFAPPNSSSSSL